jgi:hypothetical protein
VTRPFVHEVTPVVTCSWAAAAAASFVSVLEIDATFGLIAGIPCVPGGGVLNVLGIEIEAHLGGLWTGIGMAPVTKQCCASAHASEVLSALIPKPVGKDPDLHVRPWSVVTADTPTGSLAFADASVEPTTVQSVLDVHARSTIESPARIGSSRKVEPPSSVTRSVTPMGGAWPVATSPMQTPPEGQDSDRSVPTPAGSGSIVNECPPLRVTASTGWPL